MREYDDPSRTVADHPTDLEPSVGAVNEWFAAHGAEVQPTADLYLEATVVTKHCAHGPPSGVVNVAPTATLAT